MKKVILLVTILALIIGGAVLAQDPNDSTDDNWCFEGEPWGDGRCNDPDPYINNYNWIAGWCHAQIENGNIVGTFYDCMGIDEPVGGAKDDHYSTKDGSLGCKPKNSIGAPGVLANDSGGGLRVTSHTGLSGGGSVKVNTDGSFTIVVPAPGVYTFSYTIAGGSSATVSLNVCKGIPV